MPRFPSAQGRLNHEPGFHLSCDENLSEGWGPPKPSCEVSGNGSVKVERSLLDQDHDAPGRNPLADGRGLEDGIFVDRISDGVEVTADGLAILQQKNRNVALQPSGFLDDCSVKCLCVTCWGEVLVPPSGISSHDRHNGPKHDSRGCPLRC